MKLRLISISILFLLFSCTDDSEEKNEDTIAFMEYPGEIEQKKELNSDSAPIHSPDDLPENFNPDTIKTDALFKIGGFDDKIYYDLLIETHLCNPNYSDSISDGSTPCSSRFFNFYPYNHKRKIDDAFLLQIKAGVNNYPYRRLLIFVRERGKLVLMNGIVGYLVERISRPNEIDDLIVAVFDDLGNDKFDRYDVLLRYKDGKYHFVEAIGDLKGKFESEDLKRRASKAILERINEKELIF
ncbi:hypothetical protein [Brumimicrobium oceani]|uniref:Lipoprotein n=1 Tax=Brumimicrobium oceani TaxID=2100725 RepID=A0A2U2XG65_9FLAO|nr:hypothetical protein [Brumimicrobium oceani]PWH86784.1 hypothetical protein DIT68_00530 [Brumimicrobium oceani]